MYVIVLRKLKPRTWKWFAVLCIALLCYFIQFIYACITEPYPVTESHLLVVFTPSFLCTIERHYKYTLIRLIGHLWTSACGFAAFTLLGLFTQTTGHPVQFCSYVLSNTMTSLFSQFSVRVCSWDWAPRCCAEHGQLLACEDSMTDDLQSRWHRLPQLH